MIFNHGGFREFLIVEEEFRDNRHFEIVFVVSRGTGSVPLGSQRDSYTPRKFATIESAANVLRKLGVREFIVKLMRPIE